MGADYQTGLERTATCPRLYPRTPNGLDIPQSLTTAASHAKRTDQAMIMMALPWASP